MPKFKSQYDERIRVHQASGLKEIPVFQLDENNEVVDSGKRTNRYAEIQSHKDEVLIENIIKSALISGTSLAASDESFGDATLLPKDGLELNERSKAANAFYDSLNPEQKSLLASQGFDALIADVIAKQQKAVAAAASDTVDNGGAKDE